ncbi:tyrosyl-DNA phosphodiesterase 1, partial [Phenoliferia sp. Uapishka_3]
PAPPPPRKKVNSQPRPATSTSNATASSSLASTSTTQQGVKPRPSSAPVPSAAPATAPISRQQIEDERLARQQAREAAGTSLPPAYKVRPAVARPTVSTISNLTDSSSTSASTSAVASSSTSSVHGFSSSSGGGGGTSNGPKPTERFWEGALKRVANLYVPDSNSYSFDAILGPKNEMVSAIVCSYVMEVEWTISHFPKDVPLLLIKPMSEGEGKGKGKPEVLDPGVREKTFRVAPVEREMYGGWTGAMHSKPIVTNNASLPQLYFKTFCRIIIPSANQVDFDWERIDNVFFVQDFPHLPSSATLGLAASNPTHTSFTSGLFTALTNLSAPPKFMLPMREYDFSKSDQVQLVVSNQGTEFYDWDGIDKGGGIASLANAIKALGFSPGGFWDVEYTSSSLSKSYPENWLSAFMAACSGIHPREWFSSKQKNCPTLPSGNRLPIRILFPTLAEVDASHGGRPVRLFLHSSQFPPKADEFERGKQGGGTLFFHDKQWFDKSFPRHLLRKGQSKRQGVVAHTKTIIAIHKPGMKPPADYKPEGWIYVGSHNFSSAAWGTLQNTKYGPGISIPNYEMGVVLPIRGDTMAEVERKASEMASFRRPCVPYGKDDVPWMQKVHTFE